MNVQDSKPEFAYTELVFDWSRPANLAWMLKAPATTDRALRNLWLLLDTTTNPAVVTKVLTTPKRPDVYSNLPTRPLLTIGVKTYRAILASWEEYIKNNTPVEALKR